jgi:hypothetical protein
MYRLSTSEDLAFFSGIGLLQVCAGKNELILNFDNNVRLTILSDFAVQVAGGTLQRFDDAVEGSKVVIGLLHDSVTEARATKDGDLSIRFNSGASMLVFDTSSNYESFLIRHGALEIVV